MSLPSSTDQVLVNFHSYILSYLRQNSENAYPLKYKFDSYPSFCGVSDKTSTFELHEWLYTSSPPSLETLRSISKEYVKETLQTYSSELDVSWKFHEME